MLTLVMNKDENKLLKKIIYKNVWIIIIKFEMKIKKFKKKELILNLSNVKKIALFRFEI